MNRGAFFLARTLPMSLKAKVEAVVYASEEPVTLNQLAQIFAGEVLHELAMADSQDPEPIAEHVVPGGNEQEQAAEPAPLENAASASLPSPETEEKKAARRRDRLVRDQLERILNLLIAEYAGEQRGMEIREIAGGYRMATKPEYHDAVRGFVKSLKPPMKLSLQALETLAVVAYKQPVTGPEVSEIRGVDSGGVLGSLIGRKLIATAGRKQVIGRPILYKTTKEFLLRFGLKDLNELPSMEEFEKMAGELAEAEAEAEDAAMRSSDLPLVSDEPTPPSPQSDAEEEESVKDPEEEEEESALTLDISPSPAELSHEQPVTETGGDAEHPPEANASEETAKL